MSIIIKNRIGQEIEIPRPMSMVIKKLGIEDGMDRVSVDEILQQTSLHAVALGNSESYHILSNAISELETWTDENVHVDL